MSKRPGKSILANFGAFAEAHDKSEDRPAEPVVRDSTSSQKPFVRVGAGVIGATQRSLSELIEQRDRLQAIADGGGSVELSPDVIEPSPFPDRLADDTDIPFSEFKRSIEENGQQVPIQVRRHPQREGHYQVVYGHRRWRAAKDLGIAVKAVVIDLKDTELVVAQGIENGQRQDLSWIERALFVSTMDEAGIKTKDIRAALSIDDAELAKMRSVCRLVPRDICRLIGRAPSVGRPRWQEFAASLGERTKDQAQLRATLSSDKVQGLDSDARFRLAWMSLQSDQIRKAEATKLVTLSGREFGTIVFAKGVLKIGLPANEGSDFAEYLERKLPGMIDDFLASKEAKD